MNFTRTLAKLAVLTALVIGGSYGIVFYRDHYSAEHEISQLQMEKHQLQQVVKRLSDEHRVADVLVTGRIKTPTGVKTTLMFVEYAKDGSTLPPKSFTIDGDEVHIDAMVIKFDHGFVEQGDAMRGQSIALFTKLYGATQSPQQAFPIDTPGRIPDYYRGDDPVVTSFEQELWANFWEAGRGSRVRRRQRRPHRQRPGALGSVRARQAVHDHVGIQRRFEPQQRTAEGDLQGAAEAERDLVFATKFRVAPKRADITSESLSCTPGANRGRFRWYDR